MMTPALLTFMIKYKKYAQGASQMTIANGITTSRIFLALTLLFVRPLSLEFSLIYAACGISDMLDGYIARKTATTSQCGERLDSIADLVMVIIVIIRLYPMIRLPEAFYYWIIAIIAIRAASMIGVLVKHRTFGILHTYGNKATGLLLFLSPLLLGCIQLEALTFLVCLVGTVSAAEELTIHLTSKDLELNRKSIFIIKPGEKRL